MPAPRPSLLAPRSPSPLAPRILLLLWAWLAMMLALLLYWTAQATGSQGRLLFPAIAAFAVLLVAGFDFWLHWLPKLGQRLMWAGLIGLLAGMSIYTLGWLLPAAYAAPGPVAALPATAQPVDVRYGDGDVLRLAGLEPGGVRVRPGESVPVTLYFQAPASLDHDYQLFLQLLDENGKEIANLTTHPGWGRNPTTFWTPGALYADPYLLTVTEEIDNASPVAARLYAGFIDPATEGAPGQRGAFLPLPAYDATGDEITPFVGTVVVTPHTPPALDTPATVVAGSEFGGVIRLDRVETELLEETRFLTARLLWEALGTPATGYTAFVHVLDAAGQRVAGFDRAPAGERFPTALWRAGDRILSEFEIELPASLPAGAYTVWAGLYETASAGALRLPITAAGELPTGDGQVQVGAFVVE